MFYKLEKVLRGSEGRGAIIGFAVLIAALLFSFLTVFWGIDFRDTFYLGCKFAYGESVSVFMPLTQGVFNLFQLVFGNYILVYRILNWAIYVLSAILFGYLIFPKEEASTSVSLFLIALSVFFVTLTNTNVFNGNSLTVLGLVGVFVSLKRFVCGANIWIIGVVAFLLLSLLARFPNVVIVPILIVVAPLVCQSYREYVRVLFAIVLSLVLYIGVNMIVFHGFTPFVALLSSQFSAESSAESANHSVGLLFQEYLHTLKDIMSDVKYLGIIEIIPFAACLTRKKWLRYALMMFFVLATVLFIRLRVDVVSDVINYFLLVYFYATTFVMLFVAVVCALMKRDLQSFGWCVLLLLFSVSAAAGSDTGLVLMGGPLAIFAPYILNRLMCQIDSFGSKELLAIVLSLLGLSLGAFCYSRNGLLLLGVAIVCIVFVLVWVFGNRLDGLMVKVPFYSQGRKVIIGSACFVVALFLCLTVFVKINVSFHDKPLRELTCQHDEALLKGILTNPISRDYVNEVMAEYRGLDDDNVVFFGNISAVFGYLTGKGLIPGVNFMQDDTRSNVDAVEKALMDFPIVFLCPENPAIGGWKVDEYPRLNAMLLSHGYNVEMKDCYAVYYPPCL